MPFSYNDAAVRNNLMQATLFAGTCSTSRSHDNYLFVYGHACPTQGPCRALCDRERPPPIVAPAFCRNIPIVGATWVVRCVFEYQRIPKDDFFCPSEQMFSFVNDFD